MKNLNNSRIIRKVSKVSTPPRDREKEGIFRELSAILENGGLKVRREELRRGPGWQAMSGACRLDSEAIVLVDRRLSQDDQISFLVDRIVELNPSLEPEKLAKLPHPIVSRLQGVPAT